MMNHYSIYTTFGYRCYTIINVQFLLGRSPLNTPRRRSLANETLRNHSRKKETSWKHSLNTSPLEERLPNQVPNSKYRTIKPLIWVGVKGKTTTTLPTTTNKAHSSQYENSNYTRGPWSIIVSNFELLDS